MKDNNTHYRRRRYLKTIGAVGAVGLAGCAGGDGDGEGNGDQGEAQAGGNGNGNGDGDDEEFPSRNLEMVVPWGAGGGTDSMARTVAQAAENLIDHNVQVQNRTGANGLNAANYVLDQPADGYVIWAQAAAIVANIALDRTDFGLDDIQPLARTNMDTSWFYNNPEETGVETIDDLISEADSDGITIGGVGDVGIDPVFTIQWAREAGIEDEVQYVSYDDAGEVVTNVIAGRLDAGHGELQEFQSQLDSGDVQTLLGGLEERPDELPDTPTTVEKGWDLTLGNFRGLLLKGGVPEDRVEYLDGLVEEAMQSDEYREFEENSMLHLREGYMPHDEYGDFLAENVDVYADIL